MSWDDQAACKGQLELFYPPAGEQPAGAILRERDAARVCRACPVVAQCWAAELAVTPKAESIDGYRAGMPADVRRQLYRRHYGLARGERRTPSREEAAA